MTPAADGTNDATPGTRALNRALLDALPFQDTQDFEDARRGFLAALPEVEIKNAQGRVVWSLKDYAFLDDVEAPPTVNPSLWRQARLNMHHGFFQVTDRIYQVRGFDISNMTILEGDRGLIVIDPLLSNRHARADRSRPSRPARDHPCRRAAPRAREHRRRYREGCRALRPAR